MSWTAVVPLKAAAAGKSRLAPRLGVEARGHLSQAMAGHVLAVLAACEAVSRVVLLTPDPPPWPDIIWRPDEGRGLNVELANLRARERGSDLLVLHADLATLGVEDVSEMAAAASASGRAIAPDRHQEGTNALALVGGQTIDFAFGTGSFARHLAQRPQAAVVRRPGLALDIDTPEDLDAALAAGFAWRPTAVKGRM